MLQGPRSKQSLAQLNTKNCIQRVARSSPLRLSLEVWGLELLRSALFGARKRLQAIATISIADTKKNTYVEFGNSLQKWQKLCKNHALH